MHDFYVVPTKRLLEKRQTWNELKLKVQEAEGKHGTVLNIICRKISERTTQNSFTA